MYRAQDIKEIIVKNTSNINLESHQISEQYLLNISLYETVKSGQIYEAVRLIKMNADVNGIIYGYRPLNAALRTDNYKLTTLLLNCKADPNLEDHKGGNALHSAVGSVQLLKLLYEPHYSHDYEPLDAHNKRKNLSILCSAINRYYIDSDLSLDPIKYIINVMKADINSLAYDCNIIHFLAAEKHDKINMLTKYIIDQGVDIESKNKLLQTALHIAARHDNTPVISYLLAKNADITALDCNNNFPLELAIEHKATGSITPIISFFVQSYQMMQKSICHIIPDPICGLIFSFLIHKSPLINCDKGKINTKIDKKKETDQTNSATTTSQTKLTQEFIQKEEQPKEKSDEQDYEKENQKITAYNALVTHYMAKYGIFIPEKKDPQFTIINAKTNADIAEINGEDSANNHVDSKAESQMLGEDNSGA